MGEVGIMGALRRYKILSSRYDKNPCNCQLCLKYQYLLFVDFLLPCGEEETLMFQYENLETVAQMNDAINDVVRRFNGVWQNGTRKVYSAEPVQSLSIASLASKWSARQPDNDMGVLEIQLKSDRSVRKEGRE